MTEKSTGNRFPPKVYLFGKELAPEIELFIKVLRFSQQNIKYFLISFQCYPKCTQHGQTLIHRQHHNCVRNQSYNYPTYRLLHLETPRLPDFVLTSIKIKSLVLQHLHKFIELLVTILTQVSYRTLGQSVDKPRG